MREIPLTKGQVALVDDEDYELVSRYRWFAYWNGKTFYAYAHVKRESKKVISKFMHRLLLNAPRGVQVDHADGNGLNNLRSNIRICTIAENQQNRHSGYGVTGLKGVTWHKQKNKWQAQIHKDYKNIYLGLFTDPRTAALAYDEAAMKLFGEFACTNKQLGLI